MKKSLKYLRSSTLLIKSCDVNSFQVR